MSGPVGRRRRVPGRGEGFLIAREYVGSGRAYGFYRTCRSLEENRSCTRPIQIAIRFMICLAGGV